MIELSNANVFSIAKNIIIDDFQDKTKVKNTIIDECNRQLSKHIGEESYTRAILLVKSVIQDCKKLSIDWISYKNDNFPKGLLDLNGQRYDVPPILFFKGDITRINKYRNVAVIGTREPIELTLDVGYQLAKELGNRQINIISGLAKGCDKIAHKGALDSSHGYTVAIMAGGLDKIYPAENKELAEEILNKGGCLISEYAPYVRPQKWTFAQRDRLQSGISESIVVLQTKEIGGTNITVDYAKKQKRVIFAYQNTTNGMSILFGGNNAIIQGGAIPLIYHLQSDIEAILALPNTGAESISLAHLVKKTEYDNYTIQALRQECRDKGLTGTSKLNKRQLIEKLTNKIGEVTLFDFEGPK